jgi:dipeptidase E
MFLITYPARSFAPGPSWTRPLLDVTYLSAPIERHGQTRKPFVIDRGLGLVDFASLPHVDHEDHPESAMIKAETMAAEVPVPTYAIDDDTAIKVIDGHVEIVSEGSWRLLPGANPRR